MTIPVEFAQITHYFTGIGAPNGAAVVYGVKNDTPRSASQLAEDSQDIFVAEIMPILCDDVSVSSTLAKMGPDDTGASAVFSDGNHAGGVGGAGAPPSVAYLITKTTSLGGRRGRGRMYLPGVEEAFVGPGGALTGTLPADLQTCCNEFLSAMNTADMPLVLLHDPATEWELNSNGQPRRVPVAGSVPAPTVIDTLSANSFVATQRRRLRP